MLAQSASESQILAPKPKNTRATVRYFNLDGTLKELRFDWGFEKDLIQFRKLCYWAAVNGVELRVIPLT